MNPQRIYEQHREDALAKELIELFERQNKSGKPDVTSIPATFLRVTVTC